MNQERALCCAGVDVGSSAVKVVIVQDASPSGGVQIVARGLERLRRRDPLQVVEATLRQALQDCSMAQDQLDYLATTGEGERVQGRTGHFYGMTAHARGALFLQPNVRAVVDIGALHARAVLMDERAKVLGHRMTSQCASGSGQFLENICRYLGVTIDEIGPLSLQGDQPEVCSSICAVLAETDVINMVSRGIRIPNILKGIHLSMAGRYVKLLTSLGASGQVLITGGLARDAGLLQALHETAEQLHAKVSFMSHVDSPLAGALGAALWGAFRARKLQERGLAFARERDS